jgi:histidinol-phosphatase (PHP family)
MHAVIATYHNHSRWSDGRHTLEELALYARALGIDELGISDHLTLTPWGERVTWSMPPEQLHQYVEEVQAMQGATGPRIRLGLEVDWFPGQAAAIERVLRGVPLDYIIGSVHYVDRFCTDGHAEKWAKLSPAQREAVHRGYWERIRSMAESGLFDIAAHLDLTKKFGYEPESDLGDVIGAALDAIAAAGMVVELNTAGWHKPCGEAYPSPALLLECRRRGIMVTLSADAHQGEHLGRDFDRGARRLAEAGYAELVRFDRRARRIEPLAAAAAPRS